MPRHIERRNTASGPRYREWSSVVDVYCTAELTREEMAAYLGADWVVVQMDDRGVPYRCWTLEGTSITNEENSDGIYWLSPNGHLVHISGHYNRVQVEGGRWAEAYQELGLTAELCRSVQEHLTTLPSETH